MSPCRFLLVLAALLLLPAAAPARAEDSPAEPDGYRMDAYRDPVPETLAGGTVVSPDEAYRLWQEREAVFIDVLPRPPKPDKLPEGTIWRAPKRSNIPGSVWLPNVGFGKLNPEVEAYFRGNLARLAGGDWEKPLLFYCLADCWMSWNAAKRALAYGYRQVYWFPEGTDGWALVGDGLEPCEPVPLQP
jgi:PQQ-dependent catabolism-associated CXXCW motif protein